MVIYSKMGKTYLKQNSFSEKTGIIFHFYKYFKEISGFNRKQDIHYKQATCYFG